MKKYWMVHRKGTNTGYTHDSEESALREAARLAKDNPMHTFYVLETTKTVRKRPDVDVVDLETGIFDDIPF